MKPDDAVTIELPWIPPKEVRGNSRAHYYIKGDVTQWMKSEVVIRAHNQGVVESLPAGKVMISYEFHHWRNIDLDNLVTGCKAIQDTLYPKDDPNHVVPGESTFVKNKKADGSKTIVTIQEVLK